MAGARQPPRRPLRRRFLRSVSFPSAVLQRLLLLPLLAPLLLLLLIAALNPRPSVTMRVLIWRLPSLPLGAWIALAGGGGAALSAGFTALALRQRGSPRTPPAPQAPQARHQERSAAPSRGEVPFSPPVGFSGPERAPQDPLPTISVPFRVIRRGTAAGAGPGSTPPPPPGSHGWGMAPNQAAASQPVASGAEGWEDPLADDW